MATKRTHKPKFDVGDEVVIQYAPIGSGFYKGDEGVIVERSAKERAKDPRQNRYLVKIWDDGPQRHVTKGWFYEDDLMTCTDAREVGLI